jgi:SAM-dependent methyltransferase
MNTVGKTFKRSCPICSSNSFEIVLPLTPTPLGDRLSESADAARSLTKYALDLALCSSCGHAYLPLVVFPDESYKDYFFETSDSPGLSDSMRRLANFIWQKLAVPKTSYVLDIGSNDGTWLQYFKSMGVKVIGIEPSLRHSQEASARGIETINGYFTGETSRQIRSKFGVPSLITANFVTANVPDLNDFFQGMQNLADNSTHIAILTGYHPDQFGVNMFDYIYHEHVSYFSCQDLCNIGQRFELELIDVQRIGLKGGSLQAIFRKKGDQIHQNDEVERLMQYERWLGIRSPKWFLNLSDRLTSAQESTYQLLSEVKAKKIAGYGVSHSVTTLIHHFQLVEELTALTDDNHRRQGKFAPGSGLNVIKPSDINDNDFDTVLIMAWQHDGLIRKRLSDLRFKGGIVQPLPTAELINFNA